MTSIPLSILEGRRVPPIRSSNIKTWEVCPRKYLYEEVLGIKTHERKEALDTGSVFHEALQGFYLGKTEEQVVRDATVKLDATQSQMTREYDAAGPFSLQPALDSLAQSTALGLAMGLNFWRFHPIDTAKYEVFKFGERLAVELPVSWTPQRGDRMERRVQFDLLVVKDGELWIVDHKTTSKDPTNRLRALVLSIQAALYRRIVSAVFEGKSPVPVGIVFNVIRKPTIKYCGKDKDYMAYVNRVNEWYQKEHAKDRNHPPLQQRWFRWGDDSDALARLTRFTLNAPMRARDERDGALLPAFPRAGDDACDSYNSLCPYMRLCETDPSGWPAELSKPFYKRGFREDEDTEAEKPLTVPELRAMLP